MKKGFTLIELLIVIAIIGILAVAFLPSLLGAPAKARDTQRVAAVEKIQAFLVNKSLSGDKTLGDMQPNSYCIDEAGGAETVGGLIKANLADFSGVYPKDPQGKDMKLDACEGMYEFIKFDKTNSNVKAYTGAIITAIEDLNNANFDCSKPHDSTNLPVLVAKGSVTDANAVACYVSLFQ